MAAGKLKKRTGGNEPRKPLKNKKHRVRQREKEVVIINATNMKKGFRMHLNDDSRKQENISVANNRMMQCQRLEG